MFRFFFFTFFSTYLRVTHKDYSHRLAWQWQPGEARISSVPACFDLVLMLYSSWLPARTKKEEKRLPVSWRHRLDRPGVDPNYSWRRSRDVQLNLMRRKKRSGSHTAWCACTCVESEARWAWSRHHMSPPTHKGFTTTASSSIDSFGWSVFISTELY